ncbi:hypothetical protein EGW08_008928, partial [Elysia chlorotica]
MLSIVFVVVTLVTTVSCTGSADFSTNGQSRFSTDAPNTRGRYDFRFLHRNAESLHTLVREVGTVASLDCDVHPGPGPIPEIYWYKNGSPAHMWLNQGSSKMEESGWKLVIKQLTNADEGTYTCVLRKGQVNKQKQFSLKIKDKILKQADPYG